MKKVEALRVLANSLGYDLTKKVKSSDLLLGKNRSEKGHTVRYNQLITVAKELGKYYKFKVGDKILIKTTDNVELIFSMNKGERAYCGVHGGALNYSGRLIVHVIDIEKI